jgi:hypothetical protein
MSAELSNPAAGKSEANKRGAVVSEQVQPARSFWRDESGVMVVIGTFMSFFMIGTVWYVLGIGNAINYRENLQSATDAAAFAGAVYDARGMNLLASINIIMGFVMSLVIIAKIMQVVFWIEWASECSACGPWDPEACFVCVEDTYKGLTWLGGDVPNYVKDVEKAVRVALEAMHDTEVTVAIVWPWVSASKSQVAGTYYASAGTALTTSFAYSQIPVSLDRLGDPNSISDIVQSFEDGSLSPITGNIPESRLGLPVNSAKYTDLCKMAIIDITSLDGVIPGGFLGFISGAVAEVLYAADWFFCDTSGGGGFLGAIGSLVDSIGNALGLGLNPDGQVGNDTYTYSPMQLFSGGGNGGAPKAKMGDGYFGVWSQGLGVFSNALEVAKPGLAVAASPSHKGTVIGAPPKDATIAVARGEFYYDPKSNEHGTGAQKNETSINLMDYPTHNVLWNPRWRARLVRYHAFPTVGVLGAFQSLFTGNLSGAATFAGESMAGYANSELMKTSIGSAVGDIESDLPQTVQNILTNGGAASNNVTDMHVEPTKGIYH